MTATHVAAFAEPKASVRNIATGTPGRRLVASASTRLVEPEVEEQCIPYQYALPTIAGMERVSHFLSGQHWFAGKPVHHQC